MKKICFVVNRYHPVVGGTELLCQTIVEHLNSLNEYNISVITSPNPHRNREYFLYNIFECNWQNFSLMKEHFQIFKYDLVIFFADLHSPFLNMYDFKWANKNVCVLNLDERTYELKDNFKVAQQNLKNFNNVITFCKNASVNKYLSENNIKNIYLNNFSRDILETPYDDQIKLKLGLDKNKKTILYNAAYESRKNQLNVLKAINDSDYLKNLNYIFIGAQANEYYLGECVKYAKDNSLSNIRFLNSTPDIKKIDNLYQSSDMILLASIAEGMPLVLLEALSANKPIVATDVGGTKGVLSDKLDLELLSIFFSSFELENKIKKQFEKKIDYRTIWKQNFTKERSCNNYLSLIRETLA